MPLDGARSATGKLLMMNFFIIVPLLSFTYWFLLWARRRTLALGKMSTTERGAALLSPQPVPAGRRWLFEHSADYRDLRLDGRHWQAQFGGASRPNDEPVGAYVCCNSFAFAITRFLFALVACFLLEGRIFQFRNAYPDRWWCVAAAPRPRPPPPDRRPRPPTAAAATSAPTLRPPISAPTCRAAPTRTATA